MPIVKVALAYVVLIERVRLFHKSSNFTVCGQFYVDQIVPSTPEINGRNDHLILQIYFYIELGEFELAPKNSTLSIFETNLSNYMLMISNAAYQISHQFVDNIHIIEKQPISSLCYFNNFIYYEKLRSCLNLIFLFEQNQLYFQSLYCKKLAYST